VAKYDMQGVREGGTLSNQTTKGGGNSTGTTQLGGCGFTSQKFKGKNKLFS
jgi:hypothetical protein